MVSKRNTRTLTLSLALGALIAGGAVAGGISSGFCGLFGKPPVQSAANSHRPDAGLASDKPLLEADAAFPTGTVAQVVSAQISEKLDLSPEPSVELRAHALDLVKARLDVLNDAVLLSLCQSLAKGCGHIDRVQKIKIIEAHISGLDLRDLVSVCTTVGGHCAGKPAVVQKVTQRKPAARRTPPASSPHVPAMITADYLVPRCRKIVRQSENYDPTFVNLCRSALD